MNPNDEALRMLAARMRYGEGTEPHRDRESLEASLVPMIRRALCGGKGLPPLVQWVRRHQPEQAGDGPHADPGRAAPSMARLLCNKLLEYVRPAALSGRETVVGL